MLFRVRIKAARCVLAWEAVLTGETEERYPEPKTVNATSPLTTLKVEFLLFS